jgi:PII-like signaling protein
MDFVGKAKRIRIYVKESDVIGQKPAQYALLDWLRRERAAGATLIRATAGIGTSGHLNLDLTPDLAPHLRSIARSSSIPSGGSSAS